jgi:hypothetical protein
LAARRLIKSVPPRAGNLAVVRSYQLQIHDDHRSRKREHDRVVPTDDDQARFESLPVPLALWELFQQCLSKHLSELTEGQIDREEMFWFDAGHVNAMIAVVEAEAVTTALDLREWLTLLAAFARRAADRRT